MLPVPTLADLTTFTGRQVDAAGFAGQALAQATLMFTIVTKLTDLPEDPDLRQLALNAIMELADRLVLEQPYQAIAASPFQSETIGSYTYSRATTTSLKASQGIKTGLFWWDLAVDELTQPGASVLAHGSINPVPDGLVLDAADVWQIANPAIDGPDAGVAYIRIS